ncbi:MAG: putative DNA binding domain-containing protein [Desulfomicrobium sp.]|nr:putative DNA binding domain-containing protein [Pseudomonadota bacterium]MBV1713174.1 putative DNA binding domain-containing protein [Desulfomicrobium sp.]MBU4571278.1 putative DNA binding domain-containing protein [Pseudomonadota bacterium]MBU4595540.1 putative DNA binding domain-containing protein [Pseudomonadota bacterium]MBV1719982.1 putative DNA binding domain-containing protein [Desulfomicrobium sp.]
MEIISIQKDDIETLLALNEDHFNDVKSKRIAPAKLQETFVAFANSDGGDLYVGIEDKSTKGERIAGFAEQEEANAIIATLLEETLPAVENVFVEFLDTNGKGLILHFAIPKSPKVHYTASGDCFIRVNAAKRKIKGERITQLGYSKGAELYERKPVNDVDVDEIAGNDLLANYMRRVGTHLEPVVFLRKQRLLTLQNERRIPNVGCVLLFDGEPQATLDTRCAVKVYRLRTTEKEYKREQLEEMPITINGGVEEVIHKTIDQVAKYIDGAAFQDGGRLVKLSYPSEALKEILVNAVIHRDYSLNDDIHVRVFDNRVEVQSPGKLPGYMNLDNLYQERFSRNPNLVRMLHNLPDPVNHDIGEGLDTAKNELKKAGLIEPIFEEKENAFVVTIKHQRIASVEEVVLGYLQDNPGAEITNKLVRQLSGEDDMQKVKSALQRLRASGQIKPVDENARAFNFRYVKA